MRHDIGHILFLRALLILNGVRPPVQRQKEKVHDQAQKYDAQPVTQIKTAESLIDELIEDLQWPDQKPINTRKKRHVPFPSRTDTQYSMPGVKKQ